MKEKSQGCIHDKTLEGIRRLEDISSALESLINSIEPTVQEDVEVKKTQEDMSLRHFLQSAPVSLATVRENCLKQIAQISELLFKE